MSLQTTIKIGTDCKYCKSAPAIVLNIRASWGKLWLMEALNDEERKTIYTMLDAFIGKKKPKDALSNVLHDVH